MKEDLFADVKPEHYFHVHGGGIIKNIYELRDKLIEMSDQTFHHHVTKEKNDFRSWVHDVIGDAGFSHRLGESETRIAMLAAINSHIKHREKAHHAEVCEQSRTLKCGLRDFVAGMLLGFLIGLMIGRMLF